MKVKEPKPASDAGDMAKPSKSGLEEAMKRATEELGSASDRVKSKLHMRIEPTDDGKFIVDHEHRGGMESMKSMAQNERHAPGSLKELLKHVEKHYSPQMVEKEPDGDEPKD